MYVSWPRAPVSRRALSAAASASGSALSHGRSARTAQATLGASLQRRFRGALSEPRGLNTSGAYLWGDHEAALSGPWLIGPEPWITTILCRHSAGTVLRCAGGVSAEGPQTMNNCRFM